MAFPTPDERWSSRLPRADRLPERELRFDGAPFLPDFGAVGTRNGTVPLPSVIRPVFDVVEFGADRTGSTDSSTAIQTAIDRASASGGGLVWLPRGTFRVGVPAGKSAALTVSADHVVLRGAGAGRTRLINHTASMRDRAVVCFDSDPRPRRAGIGFSPIPLGEDIEGPWTEITLTDVSGLSVGSEIVLRADATIEFLRALHMDDLWGTHRARLGGLWYPRRVVGIDKRRRRIQIDIPVRYPLLRRDGARVEASPRRLQGVGIEAMSIANVEPEGVDQAAGWDENAYRRPGAGGHGVHGAALVRLRGVRDSWIRDVESFSVPGNRAGSEMLSNGIVVEESCRVDIRNCRMARPLYGGGGGNGYMIRLHRSSDCLLMQCTVSENRHGIVFSGMACSGNVVTGGIVRRTGFQCAPPNRTGGEGNDHHMHFSHVNLVDGVQVDRDFFTAHWRGNSGTPPVHGLAAWGSVYWNLEGLAGLPGRNWIVRSEQGGTGIVVGTRGKVPGVDTPRMEPGRTDPRDWVEGVGRGDSLAPFSLYNDQCKRPQSSR